MIKFSGFFILIKFLRITFCPILAPNALSIKILILEKGKKELKIK
jgi:hypothetical protein